MHLNGIIISTQTPVEGEDFPRCGGTAWAIQQSTGLPVIHMHRDAKARDDEKTHLSTIDDGSVVFITGHGSSIAEQLSGQYISRTRGEENESLSMQWSLKNYVDLIIQNSSLKQQNNREKRPHLTVVLWVCFGADGEKNSTAAKVADLFDKQGIDVTIVANTKATKRFLGFNAIPHYNEETGLPFLTGHPSDLRIFKCVGGNLDIFPVSKPIYFNRNAVLGLEQEKPQTPEKVVALKRHPQFSAELKNREKTEQFIKENSERIVLRPSSYNKDHDNPVPYYFVISYSDAEMGLVHVLFRITADDTLEKLDSNEQWLVCTTQNFDELIRLVTLPTLVIPKASPEDERGVVSEPSSETDQLLEVGHHDKKDKPSINASFLLKMGATFTGLLSVTAFVVAALAITAVITIATAGIGTLIGVGLLAGITSMGLFAKHRGEIAKDMYAASLVPESPL